jgi:hypothetical protein
MSGYTGQTIGLQGPFEPSSAFLSKPFSRDVLMRKIREALDRPVVKEHE